MDWENMVKYVRIGTWRDMHIICTPLPQYTVLGCYKLWLGRERNAKPFMVSVLPFIVHYCSLFFCPLGMNWQLLLAITFDHWTGDTGSSWSRSTCLYSQMPLTYISTKFCVVSPIYMYPHPFIFSPPLSGVDYFNAQGSFSDAHTVEFTSSQEHKVGGQLCVHCMYWIVCFSFQSRLTAEHIVIAVGGRPKIPDNVKYNTCTYMLHVNQCKKSQGH